MARWAELRGQPRGEIVTLDQVWGLGRGWYSDDRRDPAWRRRAPEETQAFFSSLGLTGPFWSLS